MFSKKVFDYPLNQIDFNIDLVKNKKNYIYFGKTRFYLDNLRLDVYRQNGCNPILIPFDQRYVSIDLLLDTKDGRWLPANLHIRLADLEDTSLTLEHILWGLENNKIVCHMSLKFIDTFFRYYRGPKIFEDLRINDNAVRFDGFVYSFLLEKSFKVDRLKEGEVDYYFDLDIEKYMSEIPRVITHNHMCFSELILGGLNWEHEDFSYDCNINKKYVQVARTQRRAIVRTLDYDHDTKAAFFHLYKHHPSVKEIMEHLNNVFVKDDKWNMDMSSEKSIYQQLSDERGKFIRDYSNNMEIL